MKIGVILGIILICAIIIACAVIYLYIRPETAATPKVTYYALTAKVIKLDSINDIVAVEDSTGNIWEFYGTQDWELNDCVSLVMNNQGTDSIFDDSIENATFSAWTLTR